ncbi:hypothetical protein M404DRAFT_992677 [Pisolithus tinctorius Marx 270]|uniref:Uncharacterized protein n=1 Tax=Pisolithus tinctorius Marx 270 TaxID=870435 RepID=A0A0C3JZ49_PISTI|nr:hypothetical protein M404DRAFT_992677 [Pisolithus tinctorius Marx 270]
MVCTGENLSFPVTNDVVISVYETHLTLVLLSGCEHGSTGRGVSHSSPSSEPRKRRYYTPARHVTLDGRAVGSLSQSPTRRSRRLLSRGLVINAEEEVV